ncbi:MAG TPA: helix-turn-helix domain-containing protein [Candidatus Elarobacter sp.]|jgi:AcrR family transcriptional regulator|nr:helix-turn-helix domain-containing protein [Candidatus Elarobacter sp.]
MMRTRARSDIPLADHIALVAGGLFYREGIHMVGVDRVAAEAEVTKRTLYRHFPSKDLLIAAALRRAPKIRFPRDGTPRSQISGAFRAMIEFLKSSSYRGCPYIIASAELVDPHHPARVIVNELVRRRRQWFHDRVVEAGAASPELLAEQLDVLFDGALANAVKRSETIPAEAALAAAESLLDAATPRRKRGAA